eukprot:GHVS01096709.1.p1 GENE.GHVS01096709.1~~GHVS01096709.1.p1  ORF type:complete len:410 (-),score=60.64 GHVS01096709.1:330-1559(-)
MVTLSSTGFVGRCSQRFLLLSSFIVFFLFLLLLLLSSLSRHLGLFTPSGSNFRASLSLPATFNDSSPEGLPSSLLNELSELRQYMHENIEKPLQALQRPQQTSSASNFSLASLPPSTPPLTVPLSLVVPCHERHWLYIPRLLLSVAAQTRQPSETILVLAIEKDTDQIYPMTEDLLGGPSVAGLRVFVRGGNRYSGDNRLFGASQATNEVISFFDCDDYMHPQRIQVLHQVFSNQPDLDGAIHGLQGVREEHLNMTIRDLAQAPPFTKADITRAMPYTCRAIREHVPSQRRIGIEKEWNIKDKNTEPLWPGQPQWFIPVKMKLRIKSQPHNGWLTVRKNLLSRVRYPTDLRRGQDSLYNYRVLKSGGNLQVIDLKLGLYVGYKTLWQQNANNIRPSIGEEEKQERNKQK